MNIPQPFKTIQKFLAPQKNSLGDNIGSQFFKHGNRKPLIQDWSNVVMTDEDLYTGYSYAALNNRANKVSQLAINNLKTNASESTMKAKKGDVLTHPYLEVIDRSTTFSNYMFWYTISTFIDLEGVYYLMAVRTVAENRVGNIQEFKLLNPYNIRRIRNKQTGEIGGYIEARDGLVREIPPQMIIDIRNLNPFSADDPYAMTDALKENQYTLKQAGDYTRHSLKNNMAAPGILSTDMLLDDEQFRNFVARVTNQEKGLPLFGNGAGAISWDAMQIDLDKASLDKINEINRSTLMAVTGVGKTMMAIEESGTTRETAKVQKDLFIEGHIMPQLQFIIDALNQDYKKYYQADYAKNEYIIYIDNPLGTDRDAELKDVDIRGKSFELYNSLVNKGYTAELSAKYTDGEITLEELGQPTEEPKTIALPTQTEPENVPDEPQQDPEEQKQSVVDRVDNKFNGLDEQEQTVITIQQGSLQNEVTRIEALLVGKIIDNLTNQKNAFEDTTDVISNKDEETYRKELETALASFYLALLPIFASLVIAKRTKEFNMTAVFKTSPAMKREVNKLAKTVSKSHVQTVVNEVLDTVRDTYEQAVQTQLSRIEATGRKVTDADLALARKKALQGEGQAKIISEVRQKYTEISKGRAKTIANTEASRAFNQSQLQADLTFMKQNDLDGKVYKKWITRSGNPCKFCQDMASQPPIPLKQNFLELGDSVEVIDESGDKPKVKKMSIDFEPIDAGLLHPNCQCTYRLIVE